MKKQSFEGKAIHLNATITTNKTMMCLFLKINAMVINEISFKALTIVEITVQS